MTEAEWLAATDSEDLVNHLVERIGTEFGPDDGGPRIPEGAMSKRKLCLFYCGCYRSIWSLLSPRQQETVALLEGKAEAPVFSTDLYGFDEYTARRLSGDAVRQSAMQAIFFRDIFGNPFQPVSLNLAWRTEAVVGLASGIYEDRAFDRMPVLADALEDAGCSEPEILNHCRGDGPHVRGCWVVDLLLGKT